MTKARRLPSGRLSRLARLASVGARTGASLVVGRGAEAAAAHAAEVLGSLRGLAAKVGQMASYVDGVVPEAQREAYEAALSALRAAAPTSSPAAIRGVVEDELEQPIEQLFADWEDEPFASASIGQVHRARLADGREVAVKVQHPGIDRAVEADLANASVMQGIVGAVGPKSLETRRIFEEVRARFREELDYALEAERQTTFRALHATDRHIRVPEVIAERSARRVLTTVMASGQSLEQVALLDEPARRASAETLWRFVFKGNLVGGMFNADPHPGNYLFGSDGVITFLDFGCVQPIEGVRLDRARRLHFAALAGDEAAFADRCRELLETRGGAYEDAAVAYSRKCFEPLFRAPFRIHRQYVAELMDGVRDMKKLMFQKDGSVVALPPGMVFMNRLQFGFYSVLARLDVEVDYAGVERAFLAEAGLS